MRLPMSLDHALASLRNRVQGGDGPAAIRKRKAGPAQLLLVGYLSYVVIGWILLSLPFSQAQPVSALDNLFTAVSAVSTTGLISVDPGTSYTFIGEVVILALIQFGGLGYMTMSSFAFLALHAELSETQEATTRTAFGLPNSIDPRLFLRSVVLFTFGCEAVGAACLYGFFLAAGDPMPLWSAIFHAVSAFCTAGFSLYADGFVPYAGHVGINATLAALSLLGAMGFIVVVDTIRRLGGRTRHYGFTSKVILRMTVILVGLGTLLIFLIEPTIAGLNPADRLLAAFFQAMSASSTVGFNTIPIDGIANGTAMVLMVLMVIGASPAGTGGGVKTTSFAALVALVRSTLKGRANVRFFRQRVPDAQVQLATTSMACYSAFLAIGLFLLLLTEPAARFETLAFEAISALGTVGLSLGATGDLSPLGKLVIIGLMLIGRLGVLTFGFATATPDGEEGTASGDDELAV